MFTKKAKQNEQHSASQWPLISEFRLIPIFRLVFYSQALDGIAIQVARVFAFRNHEVLEAASLVAGPPGVPEIARPARARGVGKISDLRVADRLSVRAGEHGDVADLAVAGKSYDGILIALVMGDDPNLLALLLRL